MKLLNEKRGRWRVRTNDLLRESGTLNLDPNGASDEGDRRVQFPQPQLDTADREFIEESAHESFRQRFQQLGLLNGSNIDDALCHFCIVDRVIKNIGQSGRLKPTVQFQIDGERLRTSTFFRRHAAAAAELQVLDDDPSPHEGIVEDRISDCQAGK